MFDENTSLETILTTPDDSEIGYLLEVDVKYLDKTRKQSIFHSVQNLK